MMGHMVVLGMEMGMQMVPGWFADGLNLVICNTLFMKQESQLVTYAAGPVKSMVGYIIVRQEDKAKVCNVKVIPNEECVDTRLTALCPGLTGKSKMNLDLLEQKSVSGNGISWVICKSAPRLR